MSSDAGHHSNGPQPWTLAVQLPATIAYAVAILFTIFRLLYRHHLSRFSWEDTWAALALICATGCLACVWMQEAPSILRTTPSGVNWLLALTITSVVWFARMSILSSVVRIANPAPKLRFVAYCIGTLFIVMDAGLIAQKIFICIANLCHFSDSVAIAQLVTDAISDVILVAVSIRFLRDVRLHRDRRILVTSALSASMLITIVTILHSVLLFHKITNTTLIINHIKAAFALFVCNALILVTFVYRLYQKSAFNPEDSIPHGSVVDSHVVQFTSVIDIPSKFSSNAYPMTSVIRSTCDPTSTEVPTPNTFLGLGSDTSHSEHVAADGSVEDPRCDFHVCRVEVAGDD